MIQLKGKGKSSHDLTDKLEYTPHDTPCQIPVQQVRKVSHKKAM
jgi:hypothetical protein